ncbi:hypothetical protein R7127_20585 [Vibrio sp. 1159]|uniref:hypothetical protein n=1 Tax=Vibrio sp. 1159 TaxID=3074545 RepID=UPI002964A48C|nr:hypothetical protein [Vibrio sp. 1159]MDW2322668.1 hypothetical protein [Vibrio sp. 1159]
MKLKKLSFALLSASILSACGGGDSSSDNSTTDPNGNGGGTVDSNSCMTLASEKLCVSSEFAAQSGDRLYIPIIGNIPENVDLSWGITDSGVLKAPVLSKVSKGAYVVAPVSDSGGNLNIEIRGETDDQSEQGTISTTLSVAGGNNLTLNGINTITVDETSLMTVEWLAATDNAGNPASNPEYTLTVTRLIDGEPSNDIDTLTTLTTTESTRVLPGETYRLELSVKSDSGAITYSEHYDYVVADKLPELATYVTDSNPDAYSYDDGQIIDRDGTFMIVRETQDSTKALVEAKEYELYSPDAPLVVSLRIKDIDDESLNTLTSRIRAQSVTHQNSFTVSAPDVLATQATGSEFKKCVEVSNGYLKASACSPIKLSSVLCSARFELSSRPKTTVSCNYSGSVDLKAEASAKDLQFNAFWPLPKIDLPVKGTVLKLEPNVGLKTKISVPMKVTTEVGIKANADASLVASYGRYFQPTLEASIDSHSKITQKGEELFNIELGINTSTDEIKTQLDTNLGVFPIAKIGDSVEVTIEIAGQVSTKASYVQLKGGASSPAIPAFSTIDANMGMKGYVAAKAKVSAFSGTLSGLNVESSLNFDSRTFELYDHPDKVTLTVYETRQCVGSSKYTDPDIPVVLPEYGELSYGESYGYGFKHEENYTFSNMGGFSLVSVESLDSTLNASKIGTNGAYMEYEDRPAREDRKAKMLFKFQNTTSSFGAFFPTYGLDEVHTRWSSNMQYPWVCWGRGYNKEEGRGSANLTLTELANMLDKHD